MRFWDASAVVPLLVDEQHHHAMHKEILLDPVMLVWWGTPVECVSALARRERDGSLAHAGLRAALERLRRLSAEWHEILPATSVRSTAERMLRVHPLRAADALQLAAALVAAEYEPQSLGFVSLDDRLISAASREGFQIV